EITAAQTGGVGRRYGSGFGWIGRVLDREIVIPGTRRRSYGRVLDLERAADSDNSPVFSASHTFINDWYGTSRRFASILMLSRSEEGSRREIDWVDGFRFGKRAGLAPDQSTYGVESRFSQKRRSSASVLNLGMALRFFFIDHSFVSIDVSCRNNAYLLSFLSCCESNADWD